MSHLYNSEAYFTTAFIEDSGFREYDARWRIEPTDGGDGDIGINYRGLLKIGFCLGEFLSSSPNGSHRQIVVGHDFRRYSENAKNALVLGLLASGLDVLDIGLAPTPVLYFAQRDLSVEACAMVTASHNPNGWTGIKMGHGYSKTFGPDRMQAFRELVHGHGDGVEAVATPGRYRQVAGGLERYLARLKAEWSERLENLPRLRVAVETGNGTAGFVVPPLLEALGFDVVAGNVELDWNFPHFNPNPESVPFLRSVQNLVRGERAEVGICIDGDGDRIGVIDDRGDIVFSDRIGLLIAKRLEEKFGPSKFVVDVKSTTLFSTELRSQVVWEKTGHSYVKAAVARENATAGFERSGHFMFNPPLGEGYDDASVAALVLLSILCEAKREGRTLSGLLAELPRSHQSPNRQPTVSDARKYHVVDEIIRRIDLQLAAGGTFSGQPVSEKITINGIRLHFADQSWLLIRASSNTPNLVILAESFDPDGARLREIDEAVRALLREIPEVGPFEPLYEI